MPAISPLNLPLNPGAGPHQSYLSLLVRQLQAAINAIVRSLNGSTKIGDISLAVAPAVFTDIIDVSITSGTWVGLEATNALAAAEVGGGTLYVTYPAAGTARINHAALAGPQRTFKWVLVAP